MLGVFRVHQYLRVFVLAVMVHGSDEGPPFRVSNVVVGAFLVGAFDVIADIVLVFELCLVFDLEMRAEFARCIRGPQSYFVFQIRFDVFLKFPYQFLTFLATIW